MLFHESIYISLSPYRKSYRYESLNQGWQSKVCRYSYKARKFLISQDNTHLHLSYKKMRCGINTNETIINRITRLQDENNYRSPDGFNNEQKPYRKEKNITILINRCTTCASIARPSFICSFKTLLLRFTRNSQNTRIIRSKQLQLWVTKYRRQLPIEIKNKKNILYVYFK